MNAEQLLRAAIVGALKAKGTPEATHAAMCVIYDKPGDPRIEVALRDALGCDR